ncbi:putative bifunctional diguanylate cyclase/phosphodiesterase [Telluria aromaticivorans]|uniref:Bifunctional diguanylate cyclase/phosphodiesterase n=1 Tax=Telluria aromaticivorans TaxID=2725995 RepID=A0A7Y2JWH9_9BURK|nr:bifunctional diguanylate cyclase/phosphodiesterase [Telluria aromaticivorans]NNG22013.1 bifunctional diguanylate cyclase/phosphodiesterase [Telluria aromaticivorans]
MDSYFPSSGDDAAKLLRAQEISRYRITEGEANRNLHLLAQLAAQVTCADISGVTIVHDLHVAVVTGTGVVPQHFNRDDSICAHAVDVQAPFFEVQDMSVSPRFATIQFTEMRHYAAATLFSKRGYLLGTLWVMSCRPRALDESQGLLLLGLGRLAVDALDKQYCDAATGMHNRSSLLQQLQEVLAGSDASEVTVGYIDLTGFHQINEIYGRDAGDRILSEVANRLQHWIGREDLIGHLGGDRFGFALRGTAQDDRLQGLCKTIDKPFSLQEGPLYGLNARIGVVRRSLPTKVSAGALLDMAETAGRMIVSVHGFSVIREYGAVLRDRTRMLEALLKLLEDRPDAGELHMFYQPQVDFSNGCLIGFEALVRWTHPEMGVIPTQNFVALAESSGHCYELDLRIARLVCSTLRRWLDAGLHVVPVSLNLSRATLIHPRLPNAISALLDEMDIPGALLEVEVTEGHLLEAPQAIHQSVDALRSLGLRIAIDDFGIGYSNLDAIATLRFDRLKVDRRFVHGVADNPTTASLFQLIQGVAKVADAELLCEGLERQSDLDWLRHHHAYRVQGWYFSAAQSVDQAERVLRSWKYLSRQPAGASDLRTLFEVE